MVNDNTLDYTKIGQCTKDFFDSYTKVYNFFDDDISMNLFVDFFKCRLTKNCEPLCLNASQYIQERWCEISKFKKMNKVFSANFDLDTCLLSVTDIPEIPLSEKIVIYGAGNIGTELAKHYKNRSNVIIADCYYEQIKSVHSIPVISEEEAFDKFPDAIYFIANIFVGDILLEKAVNNGVSKNNFIICDYIYDTKNQYFDFYEANEMEIFVDVGVYDATTSILFAKWCKNYNKIYLFEPDGNNYIKSKENLDKSNITDYELIKLGMWNKKDSLYLNNDGSSSSVAFSSSDGAKIEVDTLDNILNGQEVTFIKMDIEGIELKALQGAEQTIKIHKPRLAISVYHKVEDILEIPLYLKSILPEYKFALRHYTSKLQETVLYAWVE